MNRLFLVTGGMGHLGSTVINALLLRGETVRALILPAESGKRYEEVEYISGDVRDKESLIPFFRHSEEEEIYLIHQFCSLFQFFCVLQGNLRPFTCRISHRDYPVSQGIGKKPYITGTFRIHVVAKCSCDINFLDIIVGDTQMLFQKQDTCGNSSLGKLNLPDILLSQENLRIGRIIEKGGHMIPLCHVRGKSRIQLPSFFLIQKPS